MFVCRYFSLVHTENPQSIFSGGITIQSAYENLLDKLEEEFGLSEEDLNFDNIEFFQPAEVYRETKTIWELVEPE